MINEHAISEQKGFLDLQDFLLDQNTDEISKYLSLSIESLEGNMKLNFTTLEQTPTTYTSTLIGTPYTDLQCLLEENLDLVHD